MNETLLAKHELEIDFLNVNKHLRRLGTTMISSDTNYIINRVGMASGGVEGKWAAAMPHPPPTPHPHPQD